MKRTILILILNLFLVCESLSQKIIYMERDGGVYKISCTVNGARMKMIFDTGASSVSLSRSMAEYLIENDYISKNDLLGTSKVRIADGSVVNAYRVNLKDVEIGGMHLYNVEATISTSQYAPLLLGQSAIQKLGKISIDGNKLIINSMSSTNNSNYIQSLRNEIYNAERAGRYSIALEKLKRLKSIDNLTGNDYCWLCICYYNLMQYKKCILTAQEAFNYDAITDSHEKAVTLLYEADAYTELKYYREAEICLLQAAIVSGNNREVLNVAIRAFGLQEIFPKDKINRIGCKDATGRRIRKRGGNPALFEYALKQLNEDPKNVIAFGNELCDAQAAGNAGIQAVHCLWGAKTEEREQMLSDKGHQSITSPHQIIDILLSEKSSQRHAA